MKRLVLALLLLTVAAAVGQTNHVVTLKMRDPSGKIVIRTYKLNAFSYTGGILTVDLDNPTLYRCGFEP